MMQAQGMPTNLLATYCAQILRIGGLCALACLLGRPQLVDKTSKVRVEGIDIMLVLDASGSMQCFDSLTDQKPRFEIAKQEAISFIKQRENDMIGLVLFGKDAISRSPLTLDKNILVDIIQELQLGDVDADATVLSTALTMAINRLKHSKAKSKIIIALTDGDPTKGLDIEPEIPIDLAKKLSIKIYTIGIGNQQGAFVKDPFLGIAQVMIHLNAQLLKDIAQKTGGRFFLAQQPQDLNRIYSIINALEKTERETDIFMHYFDLVIPFVSCVALCLLGELIVTTFVWFCI
jgi:Ca-activated chloride channel family protein